MTKDISVHIDSNEVREDILTEQVEACPTCHGQLEIGFGLAGGGFGPYGYCDSCGKIIWKCVSEE